MVALVVASRSHNLGITKTKPFHSAKNPQKQGKKPGITRFFFVCSMLWEVLKKKANSEPYGPGLSILAMLAIPQGDRGLQSLSPARSACPGKPVKD